MWEWFRGEVEISLKGFQFKLQTVLEFRTKEVDQLQQKVAEAEKIRVDIIKKIIETESTLENAFVEQGQTLENGGLDAYRSEVFYGYINHLRNLRAKQQIELSHQTQRVQQAREILKKALIKQKSLEILKEKEYKKFNKQLEKAEELFLAELAQNRYINQPPS